MVIDVCNSNGIETTIGGQAGSDWNFVRKLLDLGVSGTSVNPDPWTLSHIMSQIRKINK